MAVSILSLPNECLENIVSFVDDPFTFGSIALTCKRFLRLTENDRRVMHTNLLKSKAEYYVKLWTVANRRRHDRFGFQLYDIGGFLRECATLTASKNAVTYDKVMAVWERNGPVAAKLFTWVRDLKCTVYNSISCETRNVTLHLPKCKKSVIIRADLNRESIYPLGDDPSLRIKCEDLSVKSSSHSDASGPLDNFIHWTKEEVERATEPMKPVMKLLQEELGETIPPLTPYFFLWLCFFFPDKSDLLDDNRLCFKDASRNMKPTRTSVNMVLVDYNRELRFEDSLQKIFGQWKSLMLQDKTIILLSEQLLQEIPKKFEETIHLLSLRSEAKVLERLEEHYRRFHCIADYCPSLQDLDNRVIFDLFSRTSLEKSSTYKSYNAIPIKHFENLVMYRCIGGNYMKVWGAMHGDGRHSYEKIDLEFTLPDGKVLKLESRFNLQILNDIENNLAPSQTAVCLTTLVDIASQEFKKGKESSGKPKTTSKSTDASLNKNCLHSATKEKGASSSVSKEKTGSKSSRPVAKTSDKLPFILPSVVPPATQTSTNKTIISDLRPTTRIRKRQQRPNVHRTLLPRPVQALGSPSSVPPGAVAVSFIPQPGQTVGTILASGVSTSTATVTTQSKTVVSSKTPPETSVTSELAVVPSLVDSPSPHSVDENGFANANSSTVGLEVSGFEGTDLLAVMDHFVGNTKSLVDSTVTTSNSVDSIIGLALGTALDDNGTPPSIAGISGDSSSGFLASLPSIKTSNLELAAQTVQRIGSNTTLSTSDVHIEELNSGVAGVVPASMASPTLENILNSTGSTAQSPVPTMGDVFFSSAGPISSVVDSQSQQEALIGKESLAVPSLMLSPNADSVLPASFQSQWFNGESSNFSIGSLLDKLTTSPKKDERLVSLEESAGESVFKEPSQDNLLSSHHLLDPETALHAIMDENSVDFVKKFQDLAKELAGENNKTPTSSSSGPTFPVLSNTETNSRSSDDSNSGSLNFKHILRQTNMNGS